MNSTQSDASASGRKELFEELRHEGVRDPRVLSALERTPREEFVRADDRYRAYANQPLPIESGQTISQPLIVGLMSQLLELKGDERVLEIGTGSGYQAAILSQLARDVYSIEIDPTLAGTSSERLKRLGYANVHVKAGDGYFGWEEASPFDAVILTAVAPRVPERLVAQMRPGGRLVMPIEVGGRETLIRGIKQTDGSLKVEQHGAVAFVPMVGAVRSPTPGR